MLTDGLVLREIGCSDVTGRIYPTNAALGSLIFFTFKGLQSSSGQKSEVFWEFFQPLKSKLSARDIKSTLGQINPKAISIVSYKVKICIFRYKKIWYILELFENKN